MTPVELILARLPDAKRNSRGWQARCPAHDDRSPSLTIDAGDDGRALIRCHAGCTAEEIVAALGLGLRDLMPVDGPTVDKTRPATRPNGVASMTATSTRPARQRVFPTAREAVADLERRHGRSSASWTYQNAAGDPVGVVVRWDGPEGKIIRPVSRRGNGWIISAMSAPRPLYHLPEVASAPRVYITEGEKCADAARELGLVATTSAGGAQAARLTDWSPLAAKDCIILSDNDDAGRKYARTVVAVLAKLGPQLQLKLVDLPGLPVAGDIVDFVEARDCCTAEDIRAEIEALADMSPSIDLAAIGAEHAGGPVLVRLADVAPEPVRWLWPGRVALGKLTLIPGDPNLGKSLLTLDIAARVSTGAGWPDAPGARFEAGGVVLLSAEDDVADTLRPRADAAGADVSRIILLQAVRKPDPETGGNRSLPFTLSNDLPALETAIAAVADCRLVVIDPISAYLGGGPRFDSHRNSDVRAVLAPLAELAARRGVAVLAVTHLRKGEGPAMYRAMGSLAFVAAARAVWAVSKDKDDPTGRRRLMLPVKSNLAAEPTGLAYELRPADNGTAIVAWEPDPVSVSADDALAPPERKRGPEADERHEAEAWLRSALASGPRPARELIDEGTNGIGLSKPTLDRARKVVGIVAYRPAVPGPWWWRMPDGRGYQDAPKHRELDNLDNLAKSPGETALLDATDTKVIKLPEPGDVGPDGGCPEGELPPDDARFARVGEVDDVDGDGWGEL